VQNDKPTPQPATVTTIVDLLRETLDRVAPPKWYQALRERLARSGITREPPTIVESPENTRRFTTDRDYKIALNFVTDGGKYPECRTARISLAQLQGLIKRARLEERDRCANLAPHAQLRK